MMIPLIHRSIVWEREHLHGAGLHAPSNRQSSSGSDRDDDLIDAALREGPAKRYREKAREEARSRRAAFERRHTEQIRKRRQNRSVLSYDTAVDYHSYTIS